MEKYIIDTNLFFNMEPGLGIGKKTEDVVVGFTKIARELYAKKKAAFFMPPDAVDEFLSFFKDKEQVFIKEFLSVINIKSPDRSSLRFPADIFYKMVQDIRKRSYDGLNIAEEEVKKTGILMNGFQTITKKDFEIKIGTVIKNLRERYRKATRFGFIDSLTDLNLIVLAKEQDGYLISTDEGVISWGRRFGVKEMPVQVWYEKMNELLR